MASQPKVYNPMPSLAAPVVDPEGLLNQAWFQFFLQIWLRVGGGNTPAGAVPYLMQEPDGSFAIINPITGQSLGTIVTLAQVQPLLDVEPELLVVAGATVPGTAEPQIVGASPWVFTSAAAGTLIVESGQVELGRNASFVVCGMTGAAVPVLKGDQVRVTYYQSIPVITLLPLVNP